MKKKIICFLFLVTLCLSYASKPVNANDEDASTDNPSFYEVSRDEYKNMKDVPMGGELNENNPVTNKDPNSIIDHAISQNNKATKASGPYWKIVDGIKTFYDANDTMVFQQGSQMLIDVSKHNGEINWEKVKAAGIDGAIIRVGYGYLGEDEQFQRNVSECNRLKIPYGIYLYSYAYDSNFAYNEANGTAEMLSKVKLNLSYPIFYDIERFSSWQDSNGQTRSAPTKVADYEKIINTYIDRMSELGYEGKVHVYSYRSYLQTVLNSSKILNHVSWVAAYTQTLGFTNNYYNGPSGWQYTSSGAVNGVPSTNVDLNCFSSKYKLENSTSLSDTLITQLAASGLKSEEGYISGFTVNETIKNATAKLKSLGSISWFSNFSIPVANSDTVSTDQKMILNTTDENGNSNRYTFSVVIRGDNNGDGKISALDYVILRNYLEKRTTLSGAFEKAADTNKDGEINELDYEMIRNQLDGKSDIEQ